MTNLTGARLGDFEILRELGRGGMGVVYEAGQISLNRKVALKVLSAGLGLTPNAVKRFRREAEAAAKLHHTNVVPVYATGEADGRHCYAMELMDAPSLDHVIRALRKSSTSGPRRVLYEIRGNGRVDLRRIRVVGRLPVVHRRPELAAVELRTEINGESRDYSRFPAWYVPRRAAAQDTTAGDAESPSLPNR